jgi:hypothetical protein
MTFDATCLEGFDRRMQFLAMAVAIVRRTGRDMELERLFDDQEMDSLIMAVLVFVMEETLEENRDCTLEKISGFLERLLADVKPNFPNGRLRDLTEYIVKTVLKNDGEPRHYTLLHPEKDSSGFAWNFWRTPRRKQAPPSASIISSPTRRTISCSAPRKWRTNSGSRWRS